MTGPGSKLPSSAAGSREVLVVLAFTILGGLIRAWAPHHLGLVHFDEGIYALAGLWPFSRGGLASLDPTLIPYAPPGFPCLVGLAYLALGISDLAAILVSVLAGTLTIPATAWLARRTFGAGAGAAAAALVALSGFHIQFSRMALTDACFLLCWVFGLISGQRFLERPGPWTALALGASTGLAQLFKYNGWLIGGFVALAAIAGQLLDDQERLKSKLMSIWGYGVLAAVVAALIYWPWFRFVEAHGGYARLMAHHRSYLGGAGTWLEHLRTQVDQTAALSGGPLWVASGSIAAFLSAECVLGRHLLARRRGLGLLIAFAAVTAMLPHILWWIVSFWLPRGLAGQGASKRLLAVSWAGLSLASPFYHPYARLWLPLLALGWVVVARYIVSEFSDDPGEASKAPVISPRKLCLQVSWFLVLFYFVIAPRGARVFFEGPGEGPRPLAATDSLRLAARLVLADLPQGTAGVRMLVRPSVTYYLGGRFPVQVEPGLARLMQPGPVGFWALVDTIQLRQEGDMNDNAARLLTRWELVKEYPTELNLPTLLDVDPGAARGGSKEAARAPLWLLRPRTAGASP
jgi:4-amino-4-deoxy-L-arabinose transferase-like glycosyltransferase